MAILGRERELAQLAMAVRRVAEHELGRVVLTGPAGIGCTRVLDELSGRMATVPGVAVCRGRATEAAVGVPYHAVGEALAAGLRQVPDERLAEVVGPAGHDLCLLVPGLAERLDRLALERRAPSLIAPDQVGRRVMESILGTLDALAGDGVALLILEDLHVADPATRAFVRALQTVGRLLPVCVVLSYQDDVLHRRHPLRELAAWLAEDPTVEPVALGPLPNSDIEAIVTDAGEGGVARSRLLPAVVEGARGNPLMARWLADCAETLAGVRLSDPFDQLIGARLEALGRDAARVVRVLAVAGLALPRGLLLHLVLADGRLTIQGLEAALESGLAAEDESGVRIAHELLAEAIADLELTSERQAIHAALAERLSSQPAIAAWHWARAHRPHEARDAAIRAATAAVQVDPGESVLAQYDLALEQPGLETMTAAERASLMAGAAAASASAGQFRRAVALQRRAIENRAVRQATIDRGSRDAATRLALGEMLAELGRYQWAGGETDGALDSMQKALGIMPDQPSRVRARAQATLAQHLMIAGRFEESASLAQAAIATAVAAAAQDEETLAERGHALCTLGMDTAYLGDLERGLAMLGESADAARAAGRLDDLMRVAANRTTALDLDSRREEALAVVHASLEDARSGGLAASYGAFLRGNAADILYHLGRWDEAEAECRVALEWRMSALEAEWWPPLVLGLLLIESRADEEAERLVGRSLLHLETVPPGQWSGHVLRSAVSAALWSGDPAAALTIAEREWPRALESAELAVVAWASSTCLEAAAAAAERGREVGDPGLISRAHSLAESVLPHAEAHVRASRIAPTLGARREAELHLATARAHARRVRGGVDAHAWAELAAAWEERSMPYPEARARWWQALAILAAASEDDREAARVAARAPLGAAYLIARDLPSLPLLREVVDLAARARVPLPVMADEPGAGADDRDLEGAGAGRTTLGGAAPVAVGPGRRIARGRGAWPSEHQVDARRPRPRAGHRGTRHQRPATDTQRRVRPQPTRARGARRTCRGSDGP